MKLGNGFAKAVSAIIVWCMISSSMLGLFIFAIPETAMGATIPDVNGDVFVGSDYSRQTLVFSGGIGTLGYNLTVRAGGTVLIQDCDFRIAQNYDPNFVYDKSDLTYYILVEDGGQLIIDNSTVTNQLVNQNQAFPGFGLYVRNGGSMWVNDSILAFPGHFVVDNAKLTMWNSTIMGMEPENVNPSYFPVKYFNDAPVMLFMSSDIQLYDSHILDTYKNEDWANYPSLYSFDYPFASDNSARNEVTYHFQRNVLPGLAPWSTATQTSVYNMTMSDSKYLRMALGQNFTSLGFDIAGMSFSAAMVESMTLNINYTAPYPFATGGTLDMLSYQLPLAAAKVPTSLTITPSWDPANTANSWDKTKSVALTPMSSQDLARTIVNLTNSHAAPIFINRVWVDIELKIDTYRNITLAGDTQFLAINSEIDANNFNYTDRENFTYNKLQMLDQSKAYLYGTKITTDTGSVPIYEGVAPIIPKNRTVEITPISKASTDTTGQPLRNLVNDDGSYYTVAKNQRLEVNAFNTNGLSGNITAAKLWVRYYTDTTYRGTNYLQWNASGTVVKTNAIPIGFKALPENVTSYDLYANGIKSLSQISTLDVSYINNDVGVLNSYFDRMWIEVTLEPEAYIYRWANFNVTDSQGTPVDRASVELHDNMGSSHLKYYTPSGMLANPPIEVLNYLGRNATNFNTTSPFGKADIPVLTEIVNAYSLPRSMNPYGQRSPLNYAATVLYRNASGVLFDESTSIGFEQFPEMLKQNLPLNVTMAGLKLDKPDLVVVNLGYAPNPIYANQVGAQLNVTLKNTGKTAAMMIKVMFVDRYNGINHYLGNASVMSLLPGESINVIMPWSTTGAGPHQITVEADPANVIMEENEDNILTETVNVLPLLPLLTVSNSEIYFSMYPAMTGMPLTINATVKNANGKIAAVNATVDFYIGSPDLNGIFIGQSIVSVGIGGQVNASLSWTPSTMGKVPIYVQISNVVQYNYDHVLAYRNLTIGEPVNNRIVINNSTGPMYINSDRNDRHNYIVEQGGKLTLNGSLFISQAYDNELWIVVKDQGKLIMNGAGSIVSDRSLTIYMSDQANLTISGVQRVATSVVTIIMDDQSSIWVVNSEVEYGINAPETSQGKLVAINANFQKAWSYFGGSARADLTNVSIPSLNPVQSAEVRNYRWIIVTTYDGTGVIQLSGVYVQLKNWTGAVPTYYSSATSDINAKVNFKALCDVLTADSTSYYGNYRINGTYWFDGKRSDSARDSEVSLKYYSAPLVKNNPIETIVIPVFLSDVAIFAKDVSFSPISPVKNETVSISAIIRNVGSQGAQNVNVSFFLNTTGTKAWITSRMIASLPSGQTFNINVPWTPTVSGAAIITIIVDEGRKLNESTRANNQVNVAITVMEVPHLYASGLGFYSGQGTTPITKTFVGQAVRVDASVVNNGESTATNFLVKYWLDAPLTGRLMGSVLVPSLAVQATTTASFNWTAQTVSGQGAYQNRSVFVTFDKYTKTTDVPVSQLILVIDNRPDLAIIDASVIKAGNVVTKASPGEAVKITFNVSNLGMSAANDAMLLVNLTAGTVNYVIYNITVTQLPGQVAWYNVSWVVSGVSLGEYKLNIWANPQVKFEEGNYANNHHVINFTVSTIQSPLIIINTGGKTDYKPTESIIVTGYLQSVDGLRLENITIRVSLTDSQGFILGNTQTTTTDSFGNYVAVLIVPSYDKQDAFVTVSLNSGDQTISQSAPIKIITSSGTSIPWWMILIIVLVVLIVIVLFSLYLYRYGLGKMVECGECGALIPESSKRCPKCGTTFEMGTAKCSECGAWIPANSTDCPECHAEFMSGVTDMDDGDAYDKAMKQQYDGYVNDYREQAKAALGTKYSEDKFQEWLKTEPGFLPYDAWVKKNEDDKKAGAFACPSCATLNPRGSTICHKCGTVFESGMVKTEEEKPRTFRKVVKRSAEKKTVKKDGSPEEPKAPEEKQP
jgi:subtilase family serine protease/RNA polymerase subunit RPABC4/transcription elongation factor Spt4